MPTKYDQTIDQLVHGLKPVRMIAPLWVRVCFWAGVSYVIVMLELLLTGNLRDNWVAQMIQNPRFALELLVGLAVSPVAALMALKLSVPDEANLNDARRWVAPGLLVVLVGMMLWGLADPALEPSMAGKRPTCVWEVLGYGVLPALLMLLMVKQATPLMRGWNSVLAGLAAFTPAAIAMHIACMYDPLHILKFHIAPAAVMTVVTWLVGLRLLRWGRRLG